VFATGEVLVSSREKRFLTLKKAWIPGGLGVDDERGWTASRLDAPPSRKQKRALRGAPSKGAVSISESRSLL
jgi:hypothetical protein